MGGWGAAAGGAATGAAIGSIIPGVGTAIGAGVGGLLGGVLGGASYLESDRVKNKKWDDLSWYDKAASKISASTEGLAENIAGVVGLDEYVGHDAQDRLARLKYKRSDDAATSILGGNISGASGGGEGLPMGGPSGGGGEEGISLGRRIATEEEPALDDDNYNNNNFSF